MHLELNVTHHLYVGVRVVVRYATYEHDGIPYQKQAWFIPIAVTALGSSGGERKALSSKLRSGMPPSHCMQTVHGLMCGLVDTWTLSAGVCEKCSPCPFALVQELHDLPEIHKRLNFSSWLEPVSRNQWVDVL